MNKALVFSIDDSYVTPLKVLLYSLVGTESIPSECEIFVLCSKDLSGSSRNDLLAYAFLLQLEVRFIDVRLSNPSEMPISSSDHVSISTFYRLFVADILPDHIDIAVYLDSDMLAVRSIKSLFSLQLTSLVAAADHCEPSEAIRLWGPSSGTYFQAGVLVIPLRKWRELSLAREFRDTIKHSASLIRWWDQDVLNLVIADRWQRIPLWFNVCHNLANLIPLSQLLDNAALIHFSGSKKPWNSICTSPFSEQWYKTYADVFEQPFDRSPFSSQKQFKIPRLRSTLSLAVRPVKWMLRHF